ncbi:hypothetical protein [Thermosyntropha sp.]|uniref:hypothetical protein n=1 Tax=Thermosyntropha sp. TaxID=2740820 RepID=UPI0025FC6062|nr:hypothetical protein [Thermosyntropha sp.]MBO8158561.1 hypothetical protein [Thermosyntropha sp.]
MSKLYKIYVRKHWWFDAGIAGLYNIIKELQLEAKYGIGVKLVNDGLEFEYDNEDKLRNLLSESYEELASRYWNVSDKKQKENPVLVFYDLDKDQILLKPKKNPTPIPALFIKGSSWGKTHAVPIEEISDSKLRKRVEDFLKENDKAELWGKQKKVLFEEPFCHRKIDILPVRTGRERLKVCSVCGQKSFKCYEVSQPSFLLFASGTATRSFNSQGKNPAQICWECDLLGHFAVEAATYKKTSDSLFIVQVSSSNLKKLFQVNEKIGFTSHMRLMNEETFWTNLRMDDNSPLLYSQYPYEFLWAFYYQAYKILRKENEFSLDELLAFSLSNAPVQIVLLFVESKRDTFKTNNVIFYNDTAYIFRLLHLLVDKNDYNFPKLLFDSLYIGGLKNTRYSYFRDYFFRRVLYKKSVLLDAEDFAFYVSMREGGYLKALLDFLMLYEMEIGGVKMNSEQVQKAVNLGKSIVMRAKEKLLEEGTVKLETDIKRIKGDLYALRKSRTKEDFLNQINNLQMRYGLITSKDIEGGLLEEVPFEEFKAYCVLGALNVYNSLLPKSDKSDKEEGGIQK